MKKQFNRMKQLANQTVGRWAAGLGSPGRPARLGPVTGAGGARAAAPLHFSLRSRGRGAGGGRPQSRRGAEGNGRGGAARGSPERALWGRKSWCGLREELAGRGGQGPRLLGG